MDRSTTDHSDSDSGDSWTLIENSSTYGDDALDVPDHPIESTTAEHHDKDEDTDGISIITDSEPESSSPCEINYEHYLLEENLATEHHIPQSLAPEHHIPQFMTVTSDMHDIQNHNDQKEDDDFLGDRGEKHKTYVHRRNKRLSTVLNIIMLGSVITAAGVAIGHMWGAKTDCSMHTSPNVNKILSNLYKLQEENAYLWNKLKELTAMNNYQMNQQKTTMKQNKCKKIFEEPLINNDSKKVTKCVDGKFINDDKLLNKAVHENKFTLDEKIKNHENKKWLDGEILQPPNHKYLKKFNSKHGSNSLKHNLINENKNNYINEIIDINEMGQNEKKTPEEYLNDTKDLTNAAGAQNYFVNIKTLNKKENEAFQPEHRSLKENNKLLKSPYTAEKDFSSNNVDKNVNENKKDQSKKYKRLKQEYGYEYDFSNKGKNTKNNYNNLNEEYNLFNEFRHERHQNIKKRESNRTFKVDMKDVDILNQISEDKSGTEEELLRSIKDKKQKKKFLKSKSKVLNRKCQDCDTAEANEGKEFVKNFKDKTQIVVGKEDISKVFQTELKKKNAPRDEYDTEEDVQLHLERMKDSNIKKDHKREGNKTQKIKGNTKKEIPKAKQATEQDKKDQNRNDNQNEEQTCKRNTKNVHTENPKGKLGIKEESLTSVKDNNIKNSEKAFTKSKDFDWNETPKNENDIKKTMQTKHNDSIKDKKSNEEDYYRNDVSDEDIKKDNRYSGQKQKEERKKYDRQQSHKKVKRRNKYEQWEMKGGLFKDYDDVSMSSSQENDYLFNEPNLKGEKTHTSQLEDNSNINKIGNADNLNHDFEGKEDDDKVNWLDKRAKFRTDARQRLEQESLVKNGVNAAGWYFRRMRKREQSRGKGDNSTYRKILKHKF